MRDHRAGAHGFRRRRGPVAARYSGQEAASDARHAGTPWSVQGPARDAARDDGRRLAFGGLALLLAWSVVPGHGAAGLPLELAGGVLALVAIVRQGERSLLVYLATAPFAMAVVFMVAELVELVRSLG